MYRIHPKDGTLIGRASSCMQMLLLRIKETRALLDVLHSWLYFVGLAADAQWLAVAFVISLRQAWAIG
jgi:hypothetical protein